ncbi:MAG: M23 family metallopeptidase [Deltaproteobacteria bacterium]|nr:M23 family metallopeptidase [Deltaproteobacteria bacterium]
MWTLPALCGGEDDWQRFERRVRDEQISYEDGLKEIRCWWDVLQHAYFAERFDGRPFFPVKGYGLKHVGGRHGSGYRPSRYQFVGPNRRIGHPAQDIFVYDGNQDGLDDRTGKRVEILAVADGVVLSTCGEWTPELPSNGNRGGNYLWIYHPALRLFSYYAHLQDIRVALCERVAGGQVIATLGRTGTNAYPERSPTHLHLMLLRSRDMTPVNAYPLLAGIPD